MIIFLFIFFTSLMPWATCRTVSRCELATELKKQLTQEEYQRDLGGWICLANSHGLDTGIVTSSPNVTSQGFGIFRVSNQWWCGDEYFPGGGCGIECSKLLDDDISDDLRCAILIKSQQGFGGWYQKWHDECNGKNLDEYEFIDNCVATDPPRAPVIDKLVKEVTFTEGATNVSLSCKVSKHKPVPELEWDYDEEEFSDLWSFSPSDQPDTLSLVFPEVHWYLNNRLFKCQAKNIFGTDRHRIRIRVVAPPSPTFSPPSPLVQPSDKSPGLLYGLAVGLPLLILILGGLIFVYMFRRLAGRLDVLTKSEIREFHYGQPDNANGEHQQSVYVDPQNGPYDRKYELTEDKLLKSDTKILGEGQFGFVTKAALDGRPVAVKSLKPNTDKLYIKALLSELKIMIYLGVHPHVVSLVGAVTNKLSKGMLHIVVEYCELGDLQSYLRNRKTSFVSVGSGSSTHKGNRTTMTTTTDSITTADLIKWCEQIAMGMQHLASKKVIHGDLAARNVLLDSNRNAKVTDFGLSRQLYDYVNYVKKQQGPLPWRHMSIEALRHMSFSTESDVWAYGVSMWEIFSLGDVPYPGRSWSLDFVGELEAGLRLLQPKYAPNFIYTKMLDCWDLSLDLRPTFQSLTELNQV